MKRIAILVALALPLVALAAPPRPTLPPPEELQACPPTAVDPWLRWLPSTPQLGPWEVLPSGLARPVTGVQEAAAIARLEHAAVIPLALPDAAKLADELPTPAQALALYLAALEQNVKQADAAANAPGNAGSTALREEQRLAHARLDEARKWKAAAFRPFLIRCLDFGHAASQVWFSRTGTVLHVSHGIMTHGCPVAGRQPFVILLPFAPTELYVTVSAAA